MHSSDDRKLIRVRKAFLLVAVLIQSGCEKPGDIEIDREIEDVKAGVTISVDACDNESFARFESVISVSDSHGHGPDVGSEEWKSSIERLLGMPPSSVYPDNSNDTWCARIDNVLSGIHQRGYRTLILGTTIVNQTSSNPKSKELINEKCHYLSSYREEGVLVMLVDNVVARVDVISGSSRLPNGLGIDSSGAEIHSKFGERVTVSPHKYQETASYYSVELSPETGLEFEVDDDNVMRFRVGRYPEVQWVEGCL